MEICECMYWARADARHFLTVHHPHCEKFDPNDIMILPDIPLFEYDLDDETR